MTTYSEGNEVKSVISPLNSTPSSFHSFGEYFHDKENKVLTMRIVGQNVGVAHLSFANCFGDGCNIVIENPTTPTVTKLWSNAADWDNGIPQAGDDVVIEKDIIMVLDVDTHKLNNLDVKGRLIV